MPIRAEYCDAWHRACYNDLFCASDGGSYFSCAKEYEAIDNQTNNDEDDTVDVVLIIIIIIIALIVIGMFVFICYVRNRERKGNPYFAPLDGDNMTSPSRDNERAEDTEMQGTR